MNPMFFGVDMLPKSRILSIRKNKIINNKASALDKSDEIFYSSTKVIQTEPTSGIRSLPMTSSSFEREYSSIPFITKLLRTNRKVKNIYKRSETDS